MVGNQKIYLSFLINRITLITPIKNQPPRKSHGGWFPIF